jgi:hypothetical protein
MRDSCEGDKINEYLNTLYLIDTRLKCLDKPVFNRKQTYFDSFSTVLSVFLYNIALKSTIIRKEKQRYDKTHIITSFVDDAVYGIVCRYVSPFKHKRGA